MTRSIVPDLSTYEVWFLTGSQNLYGDETLRQVAEQSQAVVAGLQSATSIPVTVVWKPTLVDSASIKSVMLEANAAGNVIGVIAWMHTFSPAKMWIAGLDALRKPLLHLHTQADAALPYATIDMDFMNLNQAAHGDREFGYIQSRLGVARTTVVGHVSNPAVTDRIGVWARAAAGWHATHELKLARFGDNMRFVAVTEGDKTEAELRLGVQVNTRGVNDLAQTTLMSDGASVYLCTSDDEVIDLVSRGQGVFGIAVGKVRREVESSLVDLDSTPAADPQDELAARRSTRAS